VLTGLPTPSASSVLATDSIVEGIGKLQSQINGLAGGLRFMGSWDATANSPVLGSGGGEAAAGTTTSAAANKLIQTGQTFLSTVSVGDQVINQVDGQSALVTNVDSNTTLSLDGDIMLSNEAYTIDNSPFITQGNYYVVSVGGTTSLNGINQWTIGDWVIAGANNEWTKLDHSQVDGTGTVGNLTKWSSTSVIADSIVSESGTAITVDGSLSTNTNLSSTGNFAVNTNKFTVGASSGNTAFTGDLAINTNKFTVNATSGNTLAAGTITSPTFLGDLNGTINTLTTAVTQAPLNGSQKVATTAYADAAASAVPIGNYLPLAGGNMTGNTTHNDNVRTQFGASNDLQIYHDGTDSFIEDSGTGSLYVTTNAFRLLNPAENSQLITAFEGGEVNLFYNGSKKFETTSTGVSVTGNGNFTGNVVTTGTSFIGKASTSSYVPDDGVFGGIITNGGGFKITTEAVDTLTLSAVGGNMTVRGGATFGGNVTAGAITSTGLQVDGGIINYQQGDTYADGLQFLRTGATRANIWLNSANNTLNITRNLGTVGMAIDSSGYVGIGTDSPLTKLDVRGSTFVSGYLAGFDTSPQGNYAYRLTNDSANSFINVLGGNVGIGTDSPDAKLEIEDTTSRTGTTASLIVEGRQDGIANVLTLRAKDFSAPTVGIGANHGAIMRWQGFDGTDFENMGYIYVAADQTVANGDAPSYMSFGTSGDGSSAPTERMRIDSSGNVGIGRTSIAQPTTGATTLAIQGTTTTSAGAIRLYSSNDSVQAYIFADNASGLSINTSTSHPMVFRTVGVDRMRILATGNITLNSVVYGNTVGGTNRNLYIDNVGGIGGIASIRAAKKNIENISSVDWMYQLNPVTFNYRKKDEDGNYTDEAYDHITYGLIAEDTQPIADFLINYNEDEDGTKDMKGIEYSRLIVPLIKAIQELKAEVDLLKSNKCNCKN
jgi:hypothetical protein